MKTRTILDFTVSAIGLGCMPMSIEGRPDEAQSIETIHAGLDAGVLQLDTAISYHRDKGEEGHNERLIAKAVKSWNGDTSKILLATKGGHIRPGDGSWTQNGDPAYLKRVAHESARNFGVEAIPLFYYHRPDPQVPYADSIGALVELLAEGVIVRAGISNASIEQIELANSMLGGKLAAVQNEYSPAHRSTQDTLDYCREHNIAFLPWSPLGGITNAKELGAKFAPFHKVATAHGVSPQQVALAWELSQGGNVIPIPGARRKESILDSVKAADLVLTAEELASLNA